MNTGPARIGDILKQPRKPVKGATSERAELVGKFTDRLNRDRDGVKYKKLTHARVGFLLSHIKSNFDLYAFFRQAEEARSFSAYFWWALKPEHPRSAQTKQSPERAGLSGNLTHPVQPPSHTPVCH
jgi:hypothetical protein